MKKLAAIILLLGSVFFSLAADSYGTVSNLLQFHANLADLVKAEDSIDSGKLFLAEGMVTAIRIISDDAASYYAEVDFMSASYREDETIATHRVVLVFSKPVYKDLLVAKAGRALQEGQISMNTRGLAMIQYINSVPGANGSRIPVFLAHDFRVLK